jgi:uncharacterized protein (DUF362 family)
MRKGIRNLKKSRLARLMILLVGATAICWDIAFNRLEVEPGTFRYESEFDAVTSATTAVSIVTSDFTELSDPVSRETDPTYEQIESMVAKAIDLQGGLDWLISKGDQVMIKVNLVGDNSASGEGTNTDVRVVKALMRYIHLLTEGEVEMWIAEGTARINDDPSDPNSVWGTTGYIDLLKDPQLEGFNFTLLNLNQSLEDLVEVDLGSAGTSAPQGTRYHVHRAELEADVYIAVPVLKIHNTGITNALKLQIGTAPGCYYGYNKASGTTACPDGIYHNIGYRVWTTEAIVDLSKIAGIDFVLVDAVMCLEHDKTNHFWNQVRFNTVLAGADPVAVDHVSAKLMGLNPDDVAHVTLAEKVGLGTNDPDLIQMEGIPLDQAMKRVEKSEHHDGVYGQSNRTWILSQPFDVEEFGNEYFENEAAIEPIPGEDGWSEPVYFFDDRIDLHAFYEGREGIVTYAFSYFYAEREEEAELWVGSEEAITVYVNGESVYNFNLYSPLSNADRGEKKGTIHLKEGRNTLLVKSLNQFGDYNFALNICEVESDPNFLGNRVAGLKFYVDDSGTGTPLTGIPSESHRDISDLSCYPNPATDYLTLHFSHSTAEMVNAKIFDLGGKLIQTIGEGFWQPGEVELTWDLTNGNGARVKSGVYLCNISSGDRQRTIRVVVK